MTETAERAQYGGSPLFILVSGRTLPSHRGNKGRQREIAKNGQKDSFVFYTVQMPKQYLFMKAQLLRTQLLTEGTHGEFAENDGVCRCAGIRKGGKVRMTKIQLFMRSVVTWNATFGGMYTL